MKITTTRAVLLAAAAAFSLVACEGDDAATESTTVSPTEAPEGTTAGSTTTVAAAVVDTAEGSDVTDPEAAVPAPVDTAPDTITPIDTAPVDSAPGPPTAPADAIGMDVIAEQATIVIDAGEHSLVGRDGYCALIDGYTYVFVGQLDGVNASLSWQTDAPATGQFLGWQYGDSPDTSLVSVNGIDGDPPMTITFAEAGTSGTFTGWYYLVDAQSYREFSGSFSCLAS